MGESHSLQETLKAANKRLNPSGGSGGLWNQRFGPPPGYLGRYPRARLLMILRQA